MPQAASPTAEEVREELERILDDPTFRRAPSHSRLLRYLVERKAAGDEGALCEAGIAMAVFPRDPAVYDPEIDPIVRVSIGRLRERLEKHYDRFKRAPETIIALPRGRYVPEFRRRRAGAASKAGGGLAVLQTANLTGNASLDPLAHGLGERLADALVLMGRTRVLAPARIGDAKPIEIGRQLGASEVIETAISCEPNQRLRISARLIDVAAADLAWAEVRTCAADLAHAGIDALFDAVLARFVAGRGPTAPGARVPTHGTPLPPAARSKIDSARLLITHLDSASIERARELLEEVTREHPEAAAAWALRGRACVRRINFHDIPAPPLVTELEHCVAKALALDPEHVDALALQALVSHWSGRLADAEARFRDALRAAPNQTGARLGYAWLLTAQGRFDDALTELDAAASYDPLSLNVLLNRAYVLAIARRHDEARLLFETCVRGAGLSLFAATAAASNELWAGELDRAEAQYQKLAASHRHEAIVGYGLAAVAACRGNTRSARALAAQARKRTSIAQHCAEAEVHALLEDRSAAVARLRQAMAAMEGGRVLIGVHCSYAAMADDPEFVNVLGRIGLDRWCGVRKQ